MAQVWPVAIPSVIRKFPYALFTLLFPDDCRICNQPLREFSRVPVCSTCLRQPQPLEAEYFCIDCKTPYLNRFPLDSEGRCTLCRHGFTGFDRVFCFGEYDGVLAELIHLFKYARMKPLGRPLSDFMARALPRDQRFDIVVPVPLHWFRQWQRGFNQSELLARAIARRCGIRFVNAARRTRATVTQTGLSNAQRRRNVARAFQAKLRRPVRDMRVLLVDDVMTTGATASACARALKRAGAKSVALLTLARVDRRSSPDLAARARSAGV